VSKTHTRDAVFPEARPRRSAAGAEPDASHAVVIGLTAVVIAVWDETPHVLAVSRPYAPLISAEADQHRFQDGTARAMGLPFGPFDPVLHRTLEIGLRTWVEEQTRLQVGYVEQLYTFGDRGRFMVEAADAPRVVSVGYLALTRRPASTEGPESTWADWYRYFPWEDWRAGKPRLIEVAIRPSLANWAQSAPTPGQRERRWERAKICFGFDEVAWDEERVLERYELLYEAALIDEAARDQHLRAHRGDDDLPPGPARRPVLGEPMQFDHRRILATAMGRLRGKLKYRPVIFELMPETFTLSELQKTAEAIAGVRLHKQNFRRLVEKGGLVEGTGNQVRTRGRPAEEFRFRREVLRERPAPGLKLSRVRN